MNKAELKDRITALWFEQLKKASRILDEKKEMPATYDRAVGKATAYWKVLELLKGESNAEESMPGYTPQHLH